jgi:erythromycin esterase-like protein
MFGSRRRERAAFLAWAAEQALRFDPAEAEPDPGLLDALDPWLEGKRIVLLGEANHFIHEKYAYRLLFLRYLHSRGWRHVGEELAWSDGRRVDRYLASGDPAHLERVSTYGYRGGERTDRDDVPTGLLRESWQHYPEAELGGEQIRFARALHDLNDGRGPEDRIRFFGFDVDYHPWLAYEDLDAWLAPQARDPAVTEVRSVLARVPGETLDEEIDRLGRAVETIESRRGELERVFGTPGCAEIVRSARTLHASHAYTRTAHAARGYAELRAPMADRERLMCEHVDHVLSRLGPEDRVVLMAHNQHLARDDRGIRTRGGGVGPGGGRVPSVGSHLCGRSGDRVLSVWMLEDRGTCSTTFPSLGNTIRSVRGSLNALLAEVGPAFVLPTRSTDPRARLLSTELEVVSMYGSRIRVTIADQADVICFVRDVSPLRA